jgi:hypothetical protein
MTLLLGQILVSSGYCTLAQVNDARRRQMMGSEGKLGELLIQMGTLSPKQLDRALMVQRGKRENKDFSS